MGLFIYNCFLFLYRAGIQLVSPWNPKARLWLRGRNNWESGIRGWADKNPGARVVWMHCASLGEFEQGRPVLEEVRRQYPSYRIALTFFSPSGYEIRKNYESADGIFYLPMDSAANASRFLDIMKPELVLWVKYEYWYYYLTEISKRNIPLLLISGIFREGQPFFKWYGGLHRKMLQCFTHLFVQTPDSKKRLGILSLSENVTVSGDTRFDRVTEIAEEWEPVPLIEEFCGGHPVVVAGSTWPEDEEELDHYANTHPELRFIIAPHEISEDHLRDIERLFKNSIRYSHLTPHTSHLANTLIIDNIGMLSKLYKYATITYVGGGFGDDGVHNVLEAAVYGKPVVYGPEYDKYAEAIELIEAKGAFSINNALELETVLNRLVAEKYFYIKTGRASMEYVYANKGATDSILRYIQEKRLLTS
ncbi:MAG TPA: glycosyltransferase N-terminal domain-containing protein [Chitinophagaceae bacterium]|nr:glycosyltransferase N-terminal domain-containing protein [Chitinophagaceae bacterium]